MGTLEFPNLGKHCSMEDCNLIDFLPFTCDCCHQVFCLEHRSYAGHGCPSNSGQGVTVILCPLCAGSVRLVPGQDPNLTWEAHAGRECDPSNYGGATRKERCPAHGCRETLTVSNTVKCRDCSASHCLKHRFGSDHRCPGPAKPTSGFRFSSAFTGRSGRAGRAKTPPSSPAWAKLVNAAASVRASTESGVARLGTGLSQAWRGCGGTGTGTGDGRQAADSCPKCGRGFWDLAALVQHVERDHRGSSKT